MTTEIKTSIWAEQALLASGWQNNVMINIDRQGNILSAKANQAADTSECTRVKGALIPGITNLHSHAHQRAMAGLAEKMTGNASQKDSFWSWRSIMYHYLEKIDADDIHAIASQLYLEMLKNGYTGVAEFQYLHHDPKGKPYKNRAELTLQCMQAALEIGIAFTALPVLYQYGGFGSIDATPGQKRFLNNADEFTQLVESLRKPVLQSNNATLGIAPHSLRAVDEELLTNVLNQCPDIDVIHIHVAEQLKEINDCLNWSQQRPVEWLLNHFSVNDKWCLIHATHMDETETSRLASSSAVAGLCPTTEANLGDGFFNAPQYFSNNGHWGIGSDSHISISPVEELRWLEYGQRLLSHQRNVLNTQNQPATGAHLYQQASNGGAQATARLTGKIQSGYRADFVVIDNHHPRLYGRKKDDMIDSWIFSGNDNPVTDVFVGGSRVIADGQHENEAQINKTFKTTVDQLAG